MPSWYVETGCIDTHELKPLELVCVGVVIQTLICNYIMMKSHSKNNDSNMDLQPLNNKSVNAVESTIPKTAICQRIILLFQYTLVLWQYISIIGILILDIIKIKNNAISKYNDSYLNKYKCYQAILLLSSNAKTIFSYCYIVFMARIMKMQQHDTDGSLMIYVQKIIGISRFKTSLLFFAAAIAFIEVITCILVPMGLFVYVWILILFIIIGIILTNIMICFVKNKKLWMKYSWVSVSFVIYFTWIISGLAMINFISGKSYWNSFKDVMIERHWNEYIDWIKSDFEGMFRFITMII